MDTMFDFCHDETMVGNKMLCLSLHWSAFFTSLKQ